MVAGGIVDGLEVTIRYVLRVGGFAWVGISILPYCEFIFLMITGGGYVGKLSAQV